MATCGLPMSTDAQSNPREVGCEYGDLKSYGAYGGTRPMMQA
jgi:hypothetical protein